MDNKIKGLIGSIAIFGVIGAIGYSQFYKSDTEQFFYACEETLKERLKSPISYKRAKTTGPYWQQLSLEEYLNIKNPSNDEIKLSYTNIYKSAKNENGVGYYEITAVLSYDAKNSYGAPIREEVTCSSAVSNDRSFPSAIAYKTSSILIDGKSNFDWLVSR